MILATGFLRGLDHLQSKRFVCKLVQRHQQGPGHCKRQLGQHRQYQKLSRSAADSMGQHRGYLIRGPGLHTRFQRSR